MASSWRENITEQGLGDLGAGLAARILGLPENLYLVNGDPLSPTAVVWRVPLDTEPDLAYGFGVVVKVSASFPYGYPTPPD